MALAENIKIRRFALRLSQSELAKKAGISQQLVTALENGKISSTKFIPEIARALSCGVRELDPRFDNLVSTLTRSNNGLGTLAELPVLACSAHHITQMSVQIQQDPVDLIDRPAPLRNVRGGYALIISEQHMFPEFQSGDLLLVNPHLPPLAGFSCILYMDDGNQRLAKIRHLTGFSASRWHVKAWQHLPEAPDELTLDRNIWRECHRVVGRYCNR